MTRSEFLKTCGLLGISLPFQASLSACEKQSAVPRSDEKVIIIGAGAAGLSAAYLLNQQGIEFEILEASGVYGGRMKRTTDFADFPIPLGAEWLHVEKGVLAEIVNDNSTTIDIKTTFYDPDKDFGLLDGVQLSLQDIDFTEDQKFVNASWFDFFEQYIVPSVEDRIRYNTVVQAIDYSGDQVRVTTDGGELVATKIIVTAPLKMLQNKSISFSPALPAAKQAAIDETTVWDGCKAFIEFSEKFYPAFTVYETVPETAGQKLYYDAAYGQDSNQHVLGLFAVGVEAKRYNDLTAGERISFMLAELDQAYDGKASAAYLKHTFQNWNAEPFINGAYLTDYEDWRKVRTLGEPVGDKLFFAGAAYSDGTDWGSVHSSARAAKRAVEELVG
ncbi:MAG: FAD-dependent oxidoreductase [Saprospiraceae bacterium]|nr:FAD-dependent oxidoreductase [Saprospiraceae bacterium]